jgi:D-aminoacyl-tRNA deacylase
MSQNILIIYSQRDPAGSNISSDLIENYHFETTGEFFDNAPVYRMGDLMLASIQSEIIYAGPELDQGFAQRVQSYVFVSKHRAESGIPSLTAHFTGNFGKNEFGGSPAEISRYSPSLLKDYFVHLNAMRSEIPPSFSLTLEATHHGPTSLQRPCMFVELGSSEAQWKDKVAAALVAKALMNTVTEVKKYPKAAIGLGGTHYPDKFNKLLLENSDLSLGVVAPKYALALVDQQMLAQMLEKSDEKITAISLDMKGLGKEKNRILALAESSGLEIIKV